jgi:hypothetical protein
LILAGNDTIQFPAVPKIIRISGCVNAGNSTYDCPTSGGVVITVDGSDLVMPISVFIGGSACELIHVFNPQKLTCLLAPGVGYNRTCFVSAQGEVSLPHQKLSYAAPIIHRLEGCQSKHTNGQSVIGCHRNGTNTLVIHGQFFGSSNAKVLVGTKRCRSIVHDESLPHALLNCTLPPGNYSEAPILLIQDNGALSNNNVTISYTACSPGFFESPDGVSCEACGLG